MTLKFNVKLMHTNLYYLNSIESLYFFIDTVIYYSQVLIYNCSIIRIKFKRKLYTHSFALTFCII